MGKETRSRWLTVRLTDEEYSQVEKLCRNTTCNKLSDYVRKVVLNKPVNVKYRNVSLDDYLKDMLQLQKDLNGIGNNFNQSVHKLHMLDHIPQFQNWTVQHEQDKEALFSKIDAILDRINQLYRVWSQS